MLSKIAQNNNCYYYFFGMITAQITAATTAIFVASFVSGRLKSMHCIAGGHYAVCALYVNLIALRCVLVALHYESSVNHASVGRASVFHAKVVGSNLDQVIFLFLLSDNSLISFKANKYI